MRAGSRRTAHKFPAAAVDAKHRHTHFSRPWTSWLLEASRAVRSTREGGDMSSSSRRQATSER